MNHLAWPITFMSVVCKAYKWNVQHNDMQQSALQLERKKMLINKKLYINQSKYKITQYHYL